MANEKSEKVQAGRDNVEFRLREHERFLRTLISNLPGVVFRCRADENYTKEFVSDGCFGLIDYRAGEIVGAGVDAFLTKPFEPEELVATIENILTRVSRTHTRVALTAGANSGKPVFADEYFSPNNVNPDNLTDAEERIAALVAQSLSNKEIAARLDVSIRTVESHVSHILAKKGFSNRVEIARYIVDQAVV